MGRTTGIEWTDSTWNPVRGCTRVSEGCRNCYAEGVAARFSKPGQAYAGLAEFKDHDARWTWQIRLVWERLNDPLHWRAPRRIFVNSMSDLFHARVPNDWIARIFDVMGKAPQHTYQILTKRPERMVMALAAGGDPITRSLFEKTYRQTWPPKNWHFGVSVEDQDSADDRLALLTIAQCAVRFVSYEPALGPIDWESALPLKTDRYKIDQIIVGGESGPEARPMHPGWARAALAFSRRYGAAFFFKQWGEYVEMTPAAEGEPGITVSGPPHVCCDQKPLAFMRVGKKAAGALLDGVEYKEFPRCG